ncbi:MAG: hypothetical protein UZ22_OP11002001021 [Microgenomates bacterium OLB23]|nr:MAG: hypothetical protein UZ22_OP11002001021 [Microgenomates bacterium OLB23]
MTAAIVRMAANEVYDLVMANTDTSQTYDPARYGVSAADLVAQLRRELGVHKYFVNVNAAGKVVVHRLQ